MWIDSYFPPLSSPIIFFQHPAEAFRCHVQIRCYIFFVHLFFQPRIGFQKIFIPLYWITGKNHFSVFIFPHRCHTLHPITNQSNFYILHSQLSKNIRWYPYNFTIRYQLHCQERGYLLVQIHDPYQSFTFSFSFISKVFAFNLQISEFSANTSSTASDFIPITLWKKSFSFSSSFSLFLSSLILFPFYTPKINRQKHII